MRNKRMAYMLRKPEAVLYPELSYEIVGAAFDVYNTLGPGQKERTYQRALAAELKSRKIRFKEQAYLSVKFKEEIVGTYYLDFLIENKIVVELKTGNYFPRKQIDQVLQYLKTSSLKLAIILQFTEDGVRQKRIIHPDCLEADS